jgi:hypothetical protein
MSQLLSARVVGIRRAHALAMRRYLEKRRSARRVPPPRGRRPADRRWIPRLLPFAARIA